MQTATPWLSLAIWLPIAFGVAILAAGRDLHANVVRTVALVGSLLGLLVTFPLYAGFDAASAGLQFVEMSPADRERLRALLVEYCRQNPRVRRFLRHWPDAERQGDDPTAG